MRGDKDRERTFLLITIPVVALFICFNTLPLIKGFIYSFTNFKGYGSYEWVGLRNYADLFTDARVAKSYWFTFKYALLGTILTNVISLVIAMGLNSKIKGKSVYTKCTWWFGNWLYIQLYIYICTSSNRTVIRN